MIYKYEQKIVDTMLTCDLIYISEMDCNYLILVSSDDDFLPPIRTILSSGKTIYRIHPKPNNRRIPVKFTVGTLIEQEL